MDAKSKADFINSIAKEQVVPCPNCGADNKPDNGYCISCGTKIAAKTLDNEAPAARAETTAKYVEAPSVFAQGLPSWDILPPQVVVRRR